MKNRIFSFIPVGLVKKRIGLLSGKVDLFDRDYGF